MNKTPRTVTSPKKFVIGRGLLQQMHDYVKDFGDNAFIISDEFILQRVNDEAIAGLKQAGLKGVSEKFNYECTEVEIKRLGALAEAQQANVIVGIGGGKTLDSAKPLLITINFPSFCSQRLPLPTHHALHWPLFIPSKASLSAIYSCHKIQMPLLRIHPLLPPLRCVSLPPAWAMH